MGYVALPNLSGRGNGLRSVESAQIDDAAHRFRAAAYVISARNCLSLGQFFEPTTQETSTWLKRRDSHVAS